MSINTEDARIDLLAEFMSAGACPESSKDLINRISVSDIEGDVTFKTGNMVTQSKSTLINHLQGILPSYFTTTTNPNIMQANEVINDRCALARFAYSEASKDPDNFNFIYRRIRNTQGMRFKEY